MQTPSGKAQHWTRNGIQAALRTFYHTHHRAPHAAEWAMRYGLPSYATVRRVWGLLGDLYRLLGIPVSPCNHPTLSAGQGRPAHWTPARIVAAIARFHQQTGRWPETADFTAAYGLPHAVTVIRKLGTLATARRQAGMASGGHEGHGGSGRGGGPGHGQRRR